MANWNEMSQVEQMMARPRCSNCQSQQAPGSQQDFCCQTPEERDAMFEAHQNAAPARGCPDWVGGAMGSFGDVEE